MKQLRPKAWANRLTAILNLTHSSNRFPVDVKELAQGFSLDLYPHDAVVNVKSVQLPGFEGALCPRDSKAGGWNILYNDAIRSAGRINYTLAHEFGHYLIHRTNARPTFECSIYDITGRDNSQIEREANEFAATLLMPLDDFRKQIDENAPPSAADLSACAEHYGVSWTAACLRWLEYTSRSAMLVVSRDEFILWARSSNRAFREKAFFRTRSETIDVPPASPAVTGKSACADKPVRHAPSVWLNRESSEYCIESDYYDLKLSLLHLGDPPDRNWNDIED